MPDRRPDPAIEVFELDDDVRADPQQPAPAPTRRAGSRSRSAAADGRRTRGDPDIGQAKAEADEIRQGDHRDEHDPEFARGRSVPADANRIALIRGRTVTRSQLGTVVAGLIVVAFIAGLTVGRHTRPGPATVDAAPNRFTVRVTEFAGAPSIFAPEPSFTARVVAPDPLPSGTAGPKGGISGSAVFALQLNANPANETGQSLERRDAGALAGPWSLIVRRSDGSLGQHSSVVTYPVPAPAGLGTGAPVRVGAGNGHTDGFGGIIWALGGKYARIRGDVGRATLADLAGRVSVRHGRPAMAQPPTRFRVVAAEPYRAAVVAESRYDSLRLSSGPIGALVYTDVLRCASFEDALFVEGFGLGGHIGGHPAVLSSVGGGNATLAWEPTPGSVALVGFSGYLDATASRTSLVDLARGGRLLDRRQWQATHPFVVKDTNVYF